MGLKEKSSHMSLLELGTLVKDVIQSGFANTHWVTAEIASYKLHNSSGHSYIELVEKQGETVVAKMSANLWKSDSKALVKFKEATGESLQAGMKVLLLVRVLFHEVYGMQLNIKDIDPAYTLGEMALTRKLIIERLTKEGIIDNNKSLILPAVIQRIAVITSSAAAGKDDFGANIREKNNRYGYRFDLILKESAMQGAKVEETMLKALRECKDIANRLDAVVIVRGGGSVVDLHCFDNYNIAKEIALFPVPVLSGIGHDKDVSVVDMVAHRHFISPSTVAHFIVDSAAQFENRINDLRNELIQIAMIALTNKNANISNFVSSLQVFAKKYMEAVNSRIKLYVKDCVYQVTNSLNQHQKKLDSTYSAFVYNSEKYITGKRKIIENYTVMLPVCSDRFLDKTKIALERYIDSVSHLDPINVLKRGYSITLVNGKAVKSVILLSAGDLIDTRLSDGVIQSTVSKTREVIDNG